MKSQARRKRIVHDDLQPVAERIRSIRITHHLSQEQFAEKMDVSRSTVLDWEGSITPIDARNLMKMCKLFNCDADYILGRIDEKTHDIQYVSEVTGLSDYVIEQLIEWKCSDDRRTKWASTLSHIIESDNFNDMMGRVSSYLGLSELEGNVLRNNQGQLAVDVIDKEIVELYHVGRFFTNIIEDLGAKDRLQS